MKNQNRKLLIRIVFTLSFVIFATIYVYLPQKTELASALGFLTNMEKFGLDKVSDTIELSKQYPVSDEVGLAGTNTLFNVNNNTNEDITYKVYLKNNTSDSSIEYLDLTNLRYSISINNSEYSDALNVLSDGVISIDTINANTTNSYSLKLWIDYNADDSIYGSTFNATLFIEK